MTGTHDRPRKFLVTSQGVSATKWLAVALASHPDVFVAHGKHALDAVVTGELARESSTGDHESITTGNVLASWYADTALADVFAAYARVKPGVLAVGSVHSYTLDTLMKRPDAETALVDVKIVNIVRHPVTYVESHTALVRKAHRAPELRRHYETDMFRAALAQVPELALIDCADLQEFIAFTVSCFSAAGFEHDFAIAGVPHVAMEQLTGSVTALHAWCESVTGLTYAADRLERLIAAGPLNRHRAASSTARGADEVYRNWATWQRDVFALIVSPAVLRSFESLGYDLEMTRQHDPVPRHPDAVPCLADRLADGELWVAWGEAANPTLIESHPAGFNLVRYRGRIWLISQALGEIDVARLAPEELDAYRDAGAVILANTVDEAHRLADRLLVESSQPLLIEADYHGFNIVRVGRTMVALAQRLGPFDLTTATESTLANLVASGDCVVARSLQDAMSGVDRLRRVA